MERIGERGTLDIGKKRARGGRHEQRATIPAEVEQLRRELAGRGATRCRRLLFGLVVLLWPGLILTVLTLFFGVYALVDGASALVPGLRTSDRGARSGFR
jgi:uncharacterized membrane protein HdeD (DUF308 family)